uniref:Uncharacterized protein n=1 Tax=Romanomermis culicivorax TaxID=13658 RepID=A0A915IR95_ROMCU
MEASPNNHTIMQNIDDLQDFSTLKQILEADDGLKNLLTGNFNGHNFLDGGPRLKLKQIRLFLCSDYDGSQKFHSIMANQNTLTAIRDAILEDDTAVEYLDHSCRIVTQKFSNFYVQFKNEREVFWSDVLPDIQQHCMQYGADILIFDPYQGLNDAQCATALSQPFYFHQCLKQIQKCRNESEGIFFLTSFFVYGQSASQGMCFLGKNQGSSTAPIYVSEETYEKLNQSAVEQEYGKLDIDL